MFAFSSLACVAMAQTTPAMPVHDGLGHTHGRAA